MSQSSPQPDSQVPPASPEMAARLAINRTGRLTPAQRRTSLIAGGVALLILLCPLTVAIQFAILAVADDLPVATGGGIFFTVLGVFFVLLLAGLALANVQNFLPDALGGHPVRVARGPLRIRVPEKDRPELPFSYLVEDYSFAPYVAPADLPMRRDAPYIVYYAAHSRLLLSIAALDAPDAAQWEPEFTPDRGKDGE